MTVCMISKSSYEKSGSLFCSHINGFTTEIRMTSSSCIFFKKPIICKPHKQTCVPSQSVFLAHISLIYIYGFNGVAVLIDSSISFLNVNYLKSNFVRTSSFLIPSWCYTGHIKPQKGILHDPVTYL